jgi:hypothetical protein
MRMIVRAVHDPANEAWPSLSGSIVGREVESHSSVFHGHQGAYRRGTTRRPNFRCI